MMVIMAFRQAALRRFQQLTGSLFRIVRANIVSISCGNPYDNYMLARFNRRRRSNDD